jgi:diacylglycerol O-acyltransferase
MERMRPYDHFMILFETDKSPMNIGGLLVFDVSEDRKTEFAENLRAHLEAHVPRTVLARRLLPSPEHYDTDAWFRMRREGALQQIRSPVFPAKLSDQALREYVTGRGMQPLDLSRAPFEIDILSQISGPRCALYMKSHHCVADGVGFVSLVQMLSDQGVANLEGEAADVDEEPPASEAWTAMARENFEQQEPLRRDAAEKKAAAQERLTDFLADPAHQRVPAPQMAFGSEFSRERSYRTVSFSLDAVRATAKSLGGSINDVFLATASGALRAYLAKRGELPATPLISHSVRSIRREEHGLFNNWVLSIYPELATDEPDPVKRLHRIRDSMNIEKQRSVIEEDMLDVWDWPYGARDRRVACSNVAQIEAAIGPASVVLSNVPGPAERLTFAGFPLAANYPVPIVGPGRFLNITSRRNADALDMGVMVDAEKIRDADAFLAELKAAFEDLSAAARRQA